MAGGAAHHLPRGAGSAASSSCPLLLAGKKKLVPFGIFLSVGAAAAYEFGPAIIGWYANYVAGA